MSDYFSINNCRTLALPASSAFNKVHIIGVCGVAMAQLAVELSEQGYEVSGSDREFYEPMSSFLKKSPVVLKQGYQAVHVPEDVHCVVIGNAVSRDNPEVVEVEKRGCHYTFFSKALYDILIKGKYSVVVAGTHGKSTTSALLASVLHSAHASPSYFVGAQIAGFERSLQRGSGEHVVLEGDEYDSAFFAKLPKFLFYKPQLLIITSVEYDHADIYPDVESINRRFTELVLSLGVDDRVICCSDGNNLRKLIERWKKQARCSIITYGTDSYCDVRILERQRGEEGGQYVSIASEFTGKKTFYTTLAGAHNAANATSVILASEFLGLSWDLRTSGIKNFLGVTRRQQIRFSSDTVTLIEDFAHHPTAVKETIRGIKEQYPEKHLIAVFEPRSNTSRRKVFQDDYISALIEADEVILRKVEPRHNDKDIDLLDTYSMATILSDGGTNAVSLDSVHEIHDYLMTLNGNERVILLMSNGSFDGLPQQLEDSLNKAALVR
jgi:UDP-N-acetylmuramate: L-alanyl-gamma-D-glutamyl-meso-diaminopimelate ligase